MDLQKCPAMAPVDARGASILASPSTREPFQSKRRRPFEKRRWESWGRVGVIFGSRASSFCGKAPRLVSMSRVGPFRGHLTLVRQRAAFAHLERGGRELAPC